VATVRRRAGYSLVELLVALALLGVVGAVASGLLSSWRTSRACSHGAPPLLDPALARLRNDIQSAAAAGLSPTWSSLPLVLLLEDGSRLRYRVTAGHLERHAAAGADRPWRPAGSAVAVAGWRWRAVGPRVLVVEIEAWSVRRAGVPVPAGGAAAQSEPTVRELLWVALRGGGGRRAW
jgi:prepilin-type N-terminal cleavage/methylation domain-containing protein